jgi:hypothetical protein
MNHNPTQCGSVAESCYGDEHRPQHQQTDVECMGCGGDASGNSDLMLICADCQQRLADRDMLALDMRQAAKAIYQILRDGRATLPPEVRGPLRAVFHEKMAGYMPKHLREQYHNELAEAVKEGVAA